MSCGYPRKKRARNESGLTFIESGGARRDRTADINTASVALSQLSYGPRKRRMLGDYPHFVHCFFAALAILERAAE